MNITQIEEIVIPYLEQHSLKLYDIKKSFEGGVPTYSVFIDKKGGITIDELVDCNNFLSEELDKIDDSDNNYQLEVSSPGAERDIRDDDELQEAIGSYISLSKDGTEYKGELIDFKDGVITLRINLKGRFKNFNFNYKEINKLHFAIKF